ncbi:glycosyltransferase family 4 protein [Myroides phaeus]|uniref:glycosyltransferase family 4 protein n=1 Tax=Myroides phaeus TaxID=702745 RepID=UPI002DBE5E64|nr:glycosyltransferase family 4 protein [Myroides phaeus]MEC4116367.1 glycosyltransferase family 4 protein [Myroides phaeus]
MKYKLVRSSTIPDSLNGFLVGQLKFLNSYFDVVALSGLNEQLKEVGYREGVKIVDVEMARKISIKKDIISLIRLYKELKKEKPLIIHSMTPKAGLLSMLAGKMAGVPIRMHTFTGLIFPTRTGVMQKLLIKMDQLLCWSATNIYPEGEGVKKDLLNFGITKKTLKVIANGNVNGIDLEYYSITNFTSLELKKLKKDLAIDANDFVFIFVGRLVRDKGINELVSAFRNVNKLYGSSKLLLVGPYENELDPLEKDTIQEINSNKSIISVGFQSDVRPYFAISNVLAFASYREGFPNVVMQAGAMGLPSIVTNISGCNEIIIEGKNGTIIPTRSVSALEERMLFFLKNVEFYNKMKDKSREMIESRYQRELVWNALLEEYQLLVKNYEEVKNKKKF